jgi:type IV pilus assembly protein PilB
VIGQRLVRKIDDTGKQSYQSTAPETEAIKATIGALLPKAAAQAAAVSEDLGFKNLPLADQTAYTLAKGTDSADAPGGYRGRMGLYEVFEVSQAIQGLIMKKATSSEIEKAARLEGMVNMRQDGYLKVLDGRTTLDEVNRVAAEDVE